MADQQATQFSESDVTSLAQKLEQFSQTLSPGEQAALTEVIVRAMPQDDDVQGYMGGRRTPYHNIWTVNVLRHILYRTGNR